MGAKESKVTVEADAPSVVQQKVDEMVQGGKVVPDMLRDGRYRIASKDTTEAFYKQQPSAMNQSINVPSEVEHMTPQELRRYISETEGLNMGRKQIQELSQSWRFLLASDPVQHGLDAGLLCGTVAAGTVAAFRPSKRHPLQILTYFIYGYAVGVFGFPLALFAWEEYQTNKNIAAEKDLFAQQRAEFYGRMKDATRAREEEARSLPKE